MGPAEKEYEQKGVSFLLVNAFDTPEGARKFMEATGKDRPWAFADEKALDALGVHLAPCQILVDKQGRVAWTSSFGTVFDGMEGIKKALDETLKQAP